MQVPVETLDAFRIVKHLQQQGEDIECMDDFGNGIPSQHC